MELKQLLIAFFIIHFCNGYLYYKLDSQELCTSQSLKKFLHYVSNGPRITLKEGKNSAAILEQTWNASNLKETRENCNFRVEAGRHGNGVYAVLTKLKFRMDPLTGRCYDYIQFRTNNKLTEEFCGNIDEMSLIPQNQFKFEESKNEIQVVIHIDQKHEIVNPLELSMVFTAYRTCFHENDFRCNNSDPISCISKEFVNDKIINCGKHCLDEGGCITDPVTEQRIDKSSIVLSALTSMIFTMIAVGTCLWFCWRYRQCFHSEQNTTRRHSEDVPTIELPTSTAGPTNETLPGDTSPKDLPPSYESLFPER